MPSRRSRPRLPPSQLPGTPATPQPAPPVRVGGAWYGRLWQPGAPPVVVVPGIPAQDSPEGEPLAAVPERVVLFEGYAPTVTVSVRQQNQFVRQPDERTVVRGLTGWSIWLDDTPTYRSQRPSATVYDALIEVSAAVQKLLEHPVRWADPRAWQDRPVWLLRVPVRVKAFDGSQGRALLMAEPGYTLPALERVPRETPWENGGPSELWLDILSDHIWWYRASDPAAPPLSEPEPDVEAAPGSPAEDSPRTDNV